MPESHQLLGQIRDNSLCPPIQLWRDTLIQRRNLRNSHTVATPWVSTPVRCNSSPNSVFSQSSLESQTLASGSCCKPLMRGTDPESTEQTVILNHRFDSCRANPVWRHP